jgi:hypothetical protein
LHNKKSLKIIGIDIGKKGGICFLQGGHIGTASMPKKKNEILFSSVCSFLLQHKQQSGSIIVAFEKLKGIKGAGKAQTWSLAEQTGFLRGICICAGIQYLEIPPKKWQAYIFSLAQVEVTKRQSRLANGKWVNDTKAMAAIAAKRLFPSFDFSKITGRTGKLHDGIIDAMLIALYVSHGNVITK